MKAAIGYLVVTACAMTGVARGQMNGSVHIDPYGYGLGASVAGHVHHASTVGESYRRGMAAVIQAQGQYDYLTSLAARNIIETQYREIENRSLQARTVIEMRAAYKERMAAEYRAQRDRIAAAQAISPVPPIKLAWPAAFAGADLAGYRRLIERIVGQQAAGIKLSVYDRSRLAEATSLAIKKLERTSVVDAATARQFLASVLEPMNLNMASR